MKSRVSQNQKNFRISSSLGFTIVESLIVLAVSGSLMASAMLIIGGQQTKARFRSSMTDITSKIQQTMNEAATGQYPSTGNARCSQFGGEVVVTNNVQDQGTSQQCIYMGKALMFGTNAPAGDPQQYVVHTVVGLRYSGLNESSSVQSAKPRAIATGSSEQTTGWPDLSESKYLQYGAKISWMKSSAGADVAGVGFLMTPTASYTSGGDLKSGSFATSVYPINTGAPGPISKSAGVDLINNYLSAAPVPEFVKLCFKSGTEEQSGLITVGATNNSSVDLLIFAGSTCGV